MLSRMLVKGLSLNILGKKIFQIWFICVTLIILYQTDVKGSVKNMPQGILFVEYIF